LRIRPLLAHCEGVVYWHDPFGKVTLPSLSKAPSSAHGGELGGVSHGGGGGLGGGTTKGGGGEGGEGEGGGEGGGNGGGSVQRPQLKRQAFWIMMLPSHCSFLVVLHRELV
jgi:hypothetical protein